MRGACGGRGRLTARLQAQARPRPCPRRAGRRRGCRDDAPLPPRLLWQRASQSAGAAAGRRGAKARGKVLPVAPPEVPAGAGPGPEARPARREGQGASARRREGRRARERRWRLPRPVRFLGPALSGPAGRGLPLPGRSAERGHPRPFLPAAPPPRRQALHGKMAAAAGGGSGSSSSSSDGGAGAAGRPGL